MDPEEPKHSKSDMVVPSESSPSKPLPEAEALTLPEWDNEEDAVSWFLQLRRVLKSILYRYCAAIQKALRIFEENDATSYAYYQSLNQLLRSIWDRWKEFNDEKNITADFLSSSVIYDDFLGPVSWISTPRNAPQRFAREMAQLRTTMRLIAGELFLNRGLLQDAIARLAERKNGHQIAQFSGLPTSEESSDAPSEKLETLLIANNEPNLPSNDDEDLDSDEELIAEGGIKDWNLLSENGFDPILLQECGYSGEIPPEIDEHLNSDKTSKAQIIGSIRSIVWLFGYKDLVEAVDDPACVLSDEVVYVPRGTHPISFLINRYTYEQKIPSFLLESLLGRRFPMPVRVAPVFQVPARVTNEAAWHPISELYALSRHQSLPTTVLCLRVKGQKKINKAVGEVREKLGESFNINSDKLWFRGLNLGAVALSMSFFIPVTPPPPPPTLSTMSLAPESTPPMISRLQWGMPIQMERYWYSKIQTFGVSMSGSRMSLNGTSCPLFGYNYHCITSLFRGNTSTQM